MNQKTASEKGYYSTGVYSRDRAEVEARLPEFTQAGFKALLVTVPDNTLSRGGSGTGYAIMVEKRYVLDMQAKQLQLACVRHPLDVRAMRDELDARIAQLNARDMQRKAWLVEHGYEKLGQ